MVCQRVLEGLFLLRVCNTWEGSGGLVKSPGLSWSQIMKKPECPPCYRLDWNTIPG
jgi:hypothetical protein